MGLDNPSNWVIHTNDGTNLTATNTVTGEEFDGTTAAFNAKTLADSHSGIDVIHGSLENGLIIFGDGHKRFTGTATVWEDYQTPLTQGKKGQTDKPDFDYAENAYLFPQNDATEILHLNIQMPHRWKQGSIVYPHIHCIQDAAGQPVFKIDYRWYNAVGDDVPGSWSTYTMDTNVHTYVSGTKSQIVRGSSGIDGASKELSSILQCKLYRDDNVVTGDFKAVSFDMHIEIDAEGSEEEYTKL